MGYKSIQNGVYYQTITIPNPNGRDSTSYTHPIALGNKKECHDEIEVAIQEDLFSMDPINGIPQQQYCCWVNGFVPIIIKCTHEISDRVGWVEATSGSAHNAKNHYRFGYSLPDDEEYLECLKSCSNCIVKRCSNLDKDHNTLPDFCGKCADFNPKSKNLPEGDLHEDFPSKGLPLTDTEEKIIPKER